MGEQAWLWEAKHVSIQARNQRAPLRSCGGQTAARSSATADKLQAVLTELDVPARSDAVLLLLKQELDLLRLQAKIRERVEENISGEQRKHFLREQLRSIKKELGMEKDDKRALIDGFQASFDKLRAAAPAEVRGENPIYTLGTHVPPCARQNCVPPP